jgi:hypothetical protein
MDYIKPIDPDLKTCFEELWNEIVWLHVKWINFRQVYAVSEEEIKLLNKVAPEFFHIVQELFLTDVVLTISRLTDPKKTRNRENLTFERLVHEIDAQKHSGLFTECLNDLKTINHKCKPFRERRNRIIAHTDLLTAVDVDSNPVPGFSRLMVEEALEAIRQLMNRIQKYFADGQTGYEHYFPRGGGETLIRLLQDVVTYWENETEYIRVPKPGKP